MSEAPTKEVILNAAEQLYADKGFAGTSLRAIIKAAGVNTAAIHYHFGSKEALIEAVIARRAEPANRARLALLDEIEARYTEGPIPVEEIIQAFVGPIIQLRMESPDHADILPRLMARMTMEAGHELHDIVLSVFAEVRERFVPALCRALPGVDEDEVLWRMHMMIGSMCFAVAVPGPVPFPSHPDRKVRAQELVDRLVRFTAAGMTGPTSGPAGEESK